MAFYARASKKCIRNKKNQKLDRSDLIVEVTKTKSDSYLNY